MKLRSWSLVGMAVIALCIVLLTQNRDDQGAKWANPHLNINGIVFGMSREEVESLLKEVPIELVGIPEDYAYEFQSHGIIVDYEQMKTGSVREIEFDQDRYSAFDIRVGDLLEQSTATLEKYGFKKTAEIPSSHSKYEGHGIVIVCIVDYTTKNIRSIQIELEKGRVSDKFNY